MHDITNAGRQLNLNLAVSRGKAGALRRERHDGRLNVSAGHSMVYIKSWTDFESAAIDLYGRSPLKARYCVKFERPAGKLVLKVTDDVKCIKYKTHSAIILNRFEALNLRLVMAMAQPRPRKRDTPTIAGGDGDVSMAGTETAPVTAPSTPAAGGGKKKKKGKK